MFKRGGKYYFLWSTGGWTNGTYSVEYAIGDTPIGPFIKQEGKILAADNVVAEGPGHNGYLHIPEEDLWLMVYHRKYCGSTIGNERVLCIDKMLFDDNGKIVPIVMTDEWKYGN